MSEPVEMSNQKFEYHQDYPMPEMTLKCHVDLQTVLWRLSDRAVLHVKKWKQA